MPWGTAESLWPSPGDLKSAFGKNRPDGATQRKPALWWPEMPLPPTPAGCSGGRPRPHGVCCSWNDKSPEASRERGCDDGRIAESADECCVARPGPARL